MLCFSSEFELRWHNSKDNPRAYRHAETHSALNRSLNIHKVHLPRLFLDAETFLDLQDKITYFAIENLIPAREEAKKFAFCGTLQHITCSCSLHVQYLSPCAHHLQCTVQERKRIPLGLIYTRWLLKDPYSHVPWYVWAPNGNYNIENTQPVSLLSSKDKLPIAVPVRVSIQHFLDLYDRTLVFNQANSEQGMKIPKLEEIYQHNY